MQHCHTFVPCEILGDHIFKEYRIIACSSSFCMLFKYEASVKYRGQNFVDTGAGQQQWRYIAVYRYTIILAMSMRGFQCSGRHPGDRTVAAGQLRSLLFWLSVCFCFFAIPCYSLLLLMFMPQSRQWACAAPGSSVAGLLLLAKMAALPLLPCAQLTFFYIFPKFCRLTCLRVVDIDTVKGLGWWTSNMPDIFLVFMLSLPFLALGIYFVLVSH